MSVGFVLLYHSLHYVLDHIINNFLNEIGVNPLDRLKKHS